MSDSPSRSHPADSADDIQQALQAVQIALDRRDNGGDAGSLERDAGALSD